MNKFMLVNLFTRINETSHVLFQRQGQIHLNEDLQNAVFGLKLLKKHDMCTTNVINILETVPYIIIL